ncbi:MAG: transposase [Bacteroidales bacterium]|nr:transposase [Bacteroidales bacterium]
MHKSTNNSGSHKENPSGFDNFLFILSDFNKKQVEAGFSIEQVSGDGGLLLLNEVEKQIGLIEKLAGCIHDPRHQSYVEHSMGSMLKQRVMQIAAGYEDGNDCNTLRHDCVLKIYSGREQSLAAQPTMCRLENRAVAAKASMCFL